MEILNELYEKKKKIEQLICELENDVSDFKIETMKDVVERVNSRPPLTKYETGVYWLDSNMGGIPEASFIQVAGENFAGKTHLIMRILRTLSSYQKVLFFSFEMYEGLIARRVKDWSDVQLSNLLIEQKRNSLREIEQIIRNTDVKFVAIDSRMKIDTGIRDQFESNSEISKRLSKITQETGKTILLINQVSEMDLRNKRLSLKGSGDQAYDADIILYIVLDRNKNGEIIGRRYICAKDRINERTWSHYEPQEVIEHVYV